ncbi:MAG: hypothetical protein WKF88_09580 [Ferruginibacter sp.]
MTDNRQQTTDNRRQTTDNRQQTTDDRRQTTDDRQQTTDNRRQTTDNRRHEKSCTGTAPSSREGGGWAETPLRNLCALCGSAVKKKFKNSDSPKPVTRNPLNPQL